MIAGLETASGGEIFIAGRRVNDVTPKGRNVAMVFQNYALYPHMTVRENMGLNLKVSGVPREAVASRVMEAAKLLHIVDLLDRRPSQLSGGQRQRVAMGRAIVREPAVFLFDEPLSNLDAKLRVQMRGEIKALHKKVRTTAIYVTHDQIEAMTLADQVVVMNKGHIEQQGSPIELYQRPANLFVAGFIGSPAMNFLEAVVRKGPNGDVAVLNDGSHLPMRTSSVASDETVILGIRPEHIQLGSPDASARAIIDFLEPTGAETQVSLQFAGTNIVAIADGNFAAQPDEPIGLSVSPGHTHIFNRETGRAIATA
jgi:multiple sugar transport system ATP-binding protein